MYPFLRAAISCLSLFIACTSIFAFADEKTPSSPITVTKSLVSFDPKTCYEGRGQLNWAFGFSRVELLGHQGNDCVFKYIADMEMGEAHYLVRVPLDSGLVSFTNDLNKPKMGIVTSFDLKKAKCLKHGNSGLGIWSVQIGDTGEEVSYRITASPNSEMLPRPGDTVRFRVSFYEDSQQKKLLVTGISQSPYEFVVGSGKYPWLEAAMSEMTVGDTRQVSVPRKQRGTIFPDLPADRGGEMLAVEIRLVSLESAKK